MKIAITGASGYLGQLLVRRLDSEPDVESILNLDIAPSPFRSPKYRYQRADVLTDDFAKLLASIDVVYHLAFIVAPPKGKTDDEIDKINIEGSRRVFKGAIDAGVKKIVYASSIAAYGAHPDNPELLKETSPLRPNADWYYSRTKGKVEEVLDELQSRHPETIIIRFRPSIFLGPTVNNPVAQYVALPVLVNIAPELKMAFCWDEDVVEAFALARSHGESDCFNIAGDGKLTFDEIGKLLGKRVIHMSLKLMLPFLRMMAGLKLLSTQSLEWMVIATSGPILVSGEKARHKLGWKPRFTAESAVLEFHRLIDSK